MSAKYIEVKNIIKRYDNGKGVGPINLSLSFGQIHSFIGPNACGKSTLLRCLSGLEKIDSGNIKPNLNKNTKFTLGYVFQQQEPWPHLTVIDNLLIPIINLSKEKKSISLKKAKRFLEKFGLYERANDYPSTLSGGLRQRLVLARTFALNPNIIFFDEPISAIDPDWAYTFGMILSQYVSESNNRMAILVAHQMNFIKRISDSTYFMNNGLIKESGSTKYIFHNSTNKDLESFLANS